MASRRLLTLAVVALLLVAGCAGVVPGDRGEDSRPDGATDAKGATVDVTVTRVVDGDTIAVEYENGTADSVRLVGVDTPEVHVENDPGNFEGVPDTNAGRACLDRWGERASAFAKERLHGREVTLWFDPNLDRRGYYNRLLASVEVSGETFNYWLVAQGYARVYESDFSERERYYEAEALARQEGRGLWACAEDTDATPTVWGTTSTARPTTTSGAGPPLAVVDIHADAERNDNENLNDEYIVFENRGDDTLDLTGWTVRDGAGHEYDFPEGFALGPGERVTLHTGSGTDTGGDLYWGRTRAIWNNNGDTVTVMSGDGEVVVRRSYSG